MISQADLYALFDSLPGDQRCLYIDTFAALCWMHQEGKTTPAKKLLADLLDQVNAAADTDHQALIQTIMETLPGNEKHFALAVPLRAEFKTLFN